MREIPLSRGLVALVDDSDFARVMAAGPWHAYPGPRTYYARHSISPTRQITLHAFIAGWKVIDHRNGDGLDNRRENLRPATKTQNCANARIRRDNTSGFKGVRQQRSGRWQATIGGRPAVSLGTYDTAAEAARAYDAAAVQRYGEFAHLNFPGGKAA